MLVLKFRFYNTLCVYLYIIIAQQINIMEGVFVRCWWLLS